MSSTAAVAGNASQQSSAPMLDISGLNAWYDESHVLHGVDMSVRRGEVVSLLGRNGAGKTTTLKCVMGIMRKVSGSISHRGDEICARPPETIARRGVALCPEDRGIFASLTVKENLVLPPAYRPGGLTLDEIYALFPFLLERLSSQGTKLSGGEQQMLAIARILRTGADLILLDEPTEGLAPVIVDQIGNLIGQLKSKGYTIILVEQNIRFASRVSDRHFIMENGRIVSQFDGGDALENDAELAKYLSV